MGIFTSQNKSLQELPKPSSIDIGVIRGSDLGEIESHNSFSISEPNVKKKIFVKMDHYREAIDIVEKIKEKIKDIDRLVSDMQRMKTQEDEYLAKWHSEMEHVKTKLNKMDEILYDIENE
ncbi:hypothetical protein J4425_02540 [Candidatus Woesearchaeota archaeon]|nr:hypothetical protein [Candidatus Woesearchaeota archaeon]